MDTETNANADKENHGKHGCKYCDEYCTNAIKEELQQQQNDDIEWESDKEKCSGCVKRILGDGLKLGCMYCDENWDCPELTHY